MTTYNKLLISGSSVTAGTSDLVEAQNTPQTWAHFLLSSIKPTIFCNLAIPGGGNISIAKTLIYTLETKLEYTPNDTLVIFNIAPLDRVDIMCDIDHPNANKYFSWAQDLGFGWITSGSFISRIPPFKGIIEKNMGFDAVVNYNALELVGLITYLEGNGYNFYFMLDNISILADAPNYLVNFLNSKIRHWIQFDEHLSLREYCQDKQLMADSEHPNLQGHQALAQQVQQHIANTVHT